MNDQYQSHQVDVNYEVTRSHVWSNPGQAIENQAIGLWIFFGIVGFSAIIGSICRFIG